MTFITATTCATDLNDEIANNHLVGKGYTIRHIETWRRNDQSDSVIVWDVPQVAESDLPY